MHSILDIADYAYGYPDTDAFLIRDIRMRIEPGGCHCITGPTGSGKSTLLTAIQGLLDRGREYGHIRLRANGNRQAAGLVLQNPDTQILMRSIGAEVAFGLENLCVSSDTMMPRVSDALKETGLDFLMDRESKKLSMGQKYRLILAALLVMKPCLLMIDEPSGQMDAASLESLKRILNRLEFFRDVADGFWEFNSHGMLKKAGRGLAGTVKNFSVKRDREKGNEIICAKKLTVSTPKGPVWSDADFSICAEEMVAVCGENGSGKTTLIRCLAGMLPPDTGQLTVFGKAPAPEDLRYRVGYLFQDPSGQLFEDTVFRETSFQLRRREGRIFVFQTALIVTLYLIRFGYGGALSGVMVSRQIFLAFLPGIILMSSVSQPKIIHALRRFMPVRLAFVLFVSLNFIPLLITEFKRMYEVQVLRGARILPRELVRPWNWPDFVGCVLVPVIVRTLSVSGEIATAARIRNFGVSEQRTCWPYD